MVGVADHLAQVSNSEVIKYSATGFRDFTRIAASDPTMWRDVFLTNKDAVLDILGRFTEELFVLQRAIRMGDGDLLHAYFTRTRAIRRGIIEAGQDTAAPDFGRAAAPQGGDLTMRRGLWTLILLPMLASLAWAEPPQRSLRPAPRPQIAATATASVPARPPPRSAPMVRRPRPKPRSRSPRARDRSATTPISRASRSSRSSPAPRAATSRRPCSVTSVNGVRLDPPATMNCEAAEALSKWIGRGLQPAFNDQVVQLNIAGAYSCRPRNNVRGARVSEHGTGGAIDISGFVLRSGKTMTVARNYGAEIKRAKKAACGTFHTTLGPGSDGYHEDHIHLDVAHRRGSAYCH